eukprot:1147891-Pelagomonas_calceolata.AAC.2
MHGAKLCGNVKEVTSRCFGGHTRIMCSQIDMLRGTGLRQDEICNMASISVVLLGLNPETRIKPVLDYLKKRGVPGKACQGSTIPAICHCTCVWATWRSEEHQDWGMARGLWCGCRKIACPCVISTAAAVPQSYFGEACPTCLARFESEVLACLHETTAACPESTCNKWQERGWKEAESARCKLFNLSGQPG